MTVFTLSIEIGLCIICICLVYSTFIKPKKEPQEVKVTLVVKEVPDYYGSHIMGRGRVSAWVELSNELPNWMKSRHSPEKRDEDKSAS